MPSTAYMVFISNAAAERAEEFPSPARQRVGLFRRGEMAALLHDRPAPDIGIGALGETLWRPQDFGREFGIAGWDGDRSRQRPGPVLPRIIRPKRRADRAGEPVEADIREELILAEHRLDIAAAIRPGAELVDDPRRQPRRRVGQRISERLRPRALDRLVAGALAQPLRELPQISLFLRSRLRRVAFAPNRQQVHMNAEQFLGVNTSHPRGDNGAPIATLPGQARIAEPRHPLGHHIGDLLDPKALLPWRKGEAVAGQ